jgi:hypothetical protein
MLWKCKKYHEVEKLLIETAMLYQESGRQIFREISMLNPP